MPAIKMAGEGPGMGQKSTNAVRDYLSEIQNKYRTDVAGELDYRPALQKLLQSDDRDLNAVNDPAPPD